MYLCYLIFILNITVLGDTGTLRPDGTGIFTKKNEPMNINYKSIMLFIVYSKYFLIFLSLLD